MKISINLKEIELMKKIFVVTLWLCFMLWNGSAMAALIFADDFNSENGGNGQSNYSNFANWTVSDGSVDLVGGSYFPSLAYDGLSIDLDGTTSDAGIMTSRELAVEPGHTYLLSFDISGNRRYYGSDTVSVAVTNSDYQEEFTLNWDIDWHNITRPVTITSGTTSQIVFSNAGGDNQGALLDNVSFSSAAPVPLPATVMLLGPGIIGLFSFRFKKRSSL